MTSPSGGDGPRSDESQGRGVGPSRHESPGEDDGPGCDDAPDGDNAPGKDDEPRAVSADSPLAGLRALFPALHLSLVADYAALGRPRDAQAHLLRARTWAAALPDGAHRQTLYADIDRLGARLDDGPGRS